MTIARVAGQTDQLAFTTSGTSIGMTFPQNVVQGNSIVCFGRSDNTAAGTLTDDATCSDDRSSTYSKDITDQFVDEFRHYIFSAVVGSNGSCTVTYSHSGDGSSRRVIGGMEYDITGGRIVDKTKAGQGTSNAADSGNSDTITAALELLFGVINVGDPSAHPITAGSGWTERGEDSTARSQFEDQIVSSTGQYKADASLSASIVWGALLVTYKSHLPQGSVEGGGGGSFGAYSELPYSTALAVAAGTTVSAPVLTHSYTAQPPKVQLKVQPAQVTHTYTGETPKFIHTVRADVLTHTYTAQAPSVKTVVQVAATTHTYTAQQPKAQTRVQPASVDHAYVVPAPKVQTMVRPADVQHVYTGLAPNLGAGDTVSPPPATHTYTGQNPSAKTRVQPGSAQHSYTAPAPSVQTRVQPGPVTHSYTAAPPKLNTRVQPPPAIHTYTANTPTVQSGAGGATNRFRTIMGVGE